MSSPTLPAWIDLTLPMSPGMPVYPGDPPVEFLPHSSLVPDGFRVTELHLGTHAGTHLDAPAHFLVGGTTVDALPLSALVGPARVVDALDVTAGGSIERERIGPIEVGERLLIRTDWAQQYGKRAYYEEFPSLAVNLLTDLAERQVALIGLETPSVCADHAADAAAHRMLLSAGVVIVEGLTGLSTLPEHIWLIALPLRLEGLDGAPCRVIACPYPGPLSQTRESGDRGPG
jgi:kynurenine formamidase